MSITSIGSVPRVGTIAAAQAAAPVAARPQADADDLSAFFDMTGWTGPAEASVTAGPAAAKAGLPELSASVLSAILR